MPRIKKHLTAEQQAARKRQKVDRERARAQRALAAIMAELPDIQREEVCYTTIKLWVERLNAFRNKGDKVKVGDFLACSEQVDPFIADKPTHRELAEWFFEQWKYFKPGAYTVHVRGLHYALIGVANTEQKVHLPNGKLYENVKNRWLDLQRAGKFARYNRLIGLEDFEDHRTKPPIVRDFQTRFKSLDVYDNMYSFDGFELDPLPDFPSTPAIPTFPSLPYYSLAMRGQQRYRLELWIEKSTQEKAIAWVCEKYGVTLVTNQGETSMSALWKALQRAARYGSQTTTVILYVSDFDPAGKSMPVAAARKLEDMRMRYAAHVPMRLYPIALTYDQCVQYQLPRTPIKDSDQRREGFEDRYGAGATELDALEALYPGKLAELIELAIKRLQDTTLAARVDVKRSEVREVLVDITREVRARHHMDGLKEEYAAAKEAFTSIIEEHEAFAAAYAEFVEEYEQEVRRRFDAWYSTYYQPLQTRLHTAMRAVQEEMNALMPDIDEIAIPEAAEVPLDADCLYDSERSYVEQLAAYKLFAGKFEHLEDETGETDEEEGQEEEAS